jgi:hypothetical protein
MNAVVTIATAIVGIAILAVIFSSKSNTAGVLTAGGQAFANDIAAAVSPITGNGVSPNVGSTNGLSLGSLSGFMPQV